MDAKKTTTSGQHPAVKEMQANVDALKTKSLATVRAFKARVQKARKERGIQTSPGIPSPSMPKTTFDTKDPRRDGESDPPVDHVELPPATEPSKT